MNSRDFLEARMRNRTNILRQFFGSGLAAFLFWLILGITVHVWIPHGRDSVHNVRQAEGGRLVFRLVHFG